MEVAVIAPREALISLLLLLLPQRCGSLGWEKGKKRGRGTERDIPRPPFFFVVSTSGGGIDLAVVLYTARNSREGRMKRRRSFA